MLLKQKAEKMSPYPQKHYLHFWFLNLDNTLNDSVGYLETICTSKGLKKKKKYRLYASKKITRYDREHSLIL